ncbi:MAG: DUF882 domain-containing protein [Burkholderiaceae bacterium]|jgi:uncharacterized protein YcbK (DUF882 family)|nr:DUF882 domain-containing protein [Burkholderiales bacterium]MCZ8101012.1 DUF882 domain-containing protein [Burkholderiales bacterium]MCZ8340394.1 DUF882 domain-containing protein [Burkholderiaceae bacterium]
MPPARRLLIVRAAALAAPALLLSRKAGASVPRADMLSFVHIHTGESLSVGWRVEGEPDANALRRIDRLLRDVRTGDVHPIDPALLEQLHRVSRAVGSRGPFQVISGFRSPRTNAMLRRTGGGGVARASLHLEGRAIDVRLADIPLATLRDAALELRAGGVGFYPSEGFVHLDTGRVRTW